MKFDSCRMKLNVSEITWLTHLEFRYNRLQPSGGTTDSAEGIHRGDKVSQRE